MRFSLILPAATLILGCASPSALTSDLLDVELVRIEGGTFLMGDSFHSENADALPVHSIDVETFYLARFETTFTQFDAFASKAGRPLPEPDVSQRGDRAVVDVSWDDAMDFCAYIGARLPSELEWEYAAAGGAVKQEFAGTDDEEVIDEYAHYRENSHGQSLPVGQKKPNLFDLFDMSGNVAEWVNEYYEKYPEPGASPIFNDNNQRDMRLARGGSVSSEIHVARTYWRAGTLRQIRTPSIGFRCAKDQ